MLLEVADCVRALGGRTSTSARTVLKAGGRAVELVGVDDPHVERHRYGEVAG